MNLGSPEDFDRLVRDWTDYAEQWSWGQERRRPGEDWWPAAGRALWRAAATFDPARGVTFQRWLGANLRWEMSGDLRRWRRRRERLTRRDLSALEASEAEALAIHDADPGTIVLAALEALDALPEHEATPIRRRYLGGETNPEIARDRGVTRQRIAVDINRGLATLRDELAEA